MVGNPQMEDLAQLTEDNFTADTGIDVNFTILPTSELRDRVTQDVATQGGQYDVVTVGGYEVPIWAENGWLAELGDAASGDQSYDYGDLLDPMVTSLGGPDGGVYALPFYGESSFLMYRTDVFEDEGLTMPERPTWPEIADLAAEVDEARSDMAGICLRGLPGWGELFAPLTTVVNTFGGTWFTEDWDAEVDAPEFREAVEFYVELVREHGQAGAAQSGFTECLNTFGQGNAAMWYDATSASGPLEDPAASKVAGDVGYVHAPVVQTDASGWLWVWALAVPETTQQPEAAQEFAHWATSKEYEELVGEELGWSRVPAGKRQSTYDIPEYAEAAEAFGQITLQAIEEADPVDPGVQPRPTVGVQYVTIPEFADLGTKVSQEISAAIAGQGSVEDALENGQELAETIAENYR
nr:sugar ABC transporter substrate-binding protein [Phytoactinopolyspora halotolerans]